MQDETQRRDILNQTSIPDFYTEARLFDAWFTTLGENEGVEIVSETGVRVLKVISSQRLELALRDLKERYEWHPAFMDANGTAWWSLDEISAFRADTPVHVLDAEFRATPDAPLLTVRALTMNETSGLLDVSVWIEAESSMPASAQWQLFGHLLQGTDVIAGNAQATVLARDQAPNDAPIRRYNLVFSRTVPSMDRVGIGFFRAIEGSHVFMTTPSEQTDWNNQRIIVSVPPATE